MRRRTLLEDKNSGNGVVDGSKATPLSVVFANKNDGSLTIVEDDKWSLESHPEEIFEPIGIVVIPGEHGVLKDAEGRNQCGVMSLVGMNCNSPKTGGEDSIMYWGDADTDISTLTNYNKVVTCSTSNQLKPNGSEDYGQIPRQDSVGGMPTWKNLYWHISPSPYAGSDMKSSGHNSAYSDTTKSKYNALSDFDGRGNTDKILKVRGSKNYNSWKPTYNTQSDYPAASCCDMFSTVGTNQGDWYLPACGELGYIPPKFADINDTISRLRTAYGVGVELDTGDGYWSSSEYDIYNACYIYLYSGGVDHDYSKKYEVYTRAFLRL